jgi:hypothetical protein
LFQRNFYGSLYGTPKCLFGPATIQHIHFILLHEYIKGKLEIFHWGDEIIGVEHVDLFSLEGFSLYFNDSDGINFDFPFTIMKSLSNYIFDFV